MEELTKKQKMETLIKKDEYKASKNKS